MGIFARFEAASGKRIDEDGSKTRKLALVNELNLRQYGQRQAEVAQEWILRGDPVRYGSLTLADFFPSEEQLAKIRYDINGLLARADAQGYRRGYSAGVIDGERAERERHAEPPKPTPEELFELQTLRGKVEALERDNARLQVAERRLRRLERMLPRSTTTKNESANYQDEQA
jgi:hypothetical protein